MNDLLGFERPRDKVVRSFLHGFDRALDRAVGRNHDHRSIVFSLAQFAQHIHAADIGHHIIKNDEIGPESVQLL